MYACHRVHPRDVRVFDSQQARCAIMESPHNLGGNYWGTLINADKSPAPLFEQLCLGIAQLVVSRFPSDVCASGLC